MAMEFHDTCDKWYSYLMTAAKDIWDAIQQTYSKARDEAQVYNVKVKTMAAKQGSKTVTEYTNQLKFVLGTWPL